MYSHKHTSTKDLASVPLGGTMMTMARTFQMSATTSWSRPSSSQIQMCFFAWILFTTIAIHCWPTMMVEYMNKWVMPPRYQYIRWAPSSTWTFLQTPGLLILQPSRASSAGPTSCSFVLSNSSIFNTFLWTGDGFFVSLFQTWFLPLPILALAMILCRIFYGADEVKAKFQQAKFHMDVWFTGGDFAGAALEQINTAVRRRTLVQILAQFPTRFQFHVYNFFGRVLGV